MKLIRGEYLIESSDVILYHYDKLYCDPNTIEDGQTIYCDTHRILDFKNILNTKKDLTIITHNSDHQLYDGPANNPNGIDIYQLTCWRKWFGQNSFSQNVIPLPIGFENKKWETLFGPKTYWICEARSKDIIPSKTVYLNCKKCNNFDSRQHCYDVANKLEFITVDQPNLTYQAYLRKIQAHKFVLSPRGNGLDCHRTWEALMLKRVPVIKREGFLEDLYKNIPVLFVDEWTDLNQINLDSVYNEYSFDNQDYLTLNYWKEKLY